MNAPQRGIIDQSRTGTSHRLPGVAIPPLCGPGEPGCTRPRLFRYLGILLFQDRSCHDPHCGVRPIAVVRFRSVTRPDVRPRPAGRPAVRRRGPPSGAAARPGAAGPAVSRPVSWRPGPGNADDTGLLCGPPGEICRARPADFTRSAAVPGCANGRRRRLDLPSAGRVLSVNTTSR